MRSDRSRLTLPRPMVYALAALPLIDCVIDQVNNTWHPGIGSLSLLQLVNLPLLAAFAAVLAWALLRAPGSLRRMPLPVPAAFGLVLMACTAELLRTGSLSMASLAPYGQMLYWLLLWAVVAVTCGQGWQARLLLWGVALGALGTAVSVYLGFVFGTRQYYGADAVTSSAGWFDTAKMITGILITGGLVLLVLGRERHRWTATLAAWVCFTAAVLTYARAGWVALGGVLLWLTVWAALWSTRRTRRQLAPLLLLGVLAGSVVPAAVGPDKLLSRWSDVKQGEEAGSGRASFWRIAFDQYLAAPPSVQFFGRGYSGMADMLLREYGMDIRHTHNDSLDMITVFGVPGVLWLLLLLASMLFTAVHLPLRSLAMAAAVAVLCTYLLHGQFTGQLWGADVMGVYTLALSCLATIAREATERSSSVTREPLPLALACPAPN